MSRPWMPSYSPPVEARLNGNNYFLVAIFVVNVLPPGILYIYNVLYRKKKNMPEVPFAGATTLMWKEEAKTDSDLKLSPGQGICLRSSVDISSVS